MTELDQQSNLEEAEAQALRYVEELRALGGDMDSLWDRTDATIEQVAASFNIENFVPDELPTLNFSGDFKGAGRAFYKSYLKVVRESLCVKSDLRDAVQTALSGGVPAVLLTVASALAIPSGAILLIAPIAAILLVKGIDAFCDVTTAKH